MPFQRILERMRYPWFCTEAAYASMMEVVDVCTARIRSGGSLDVLPQVPQNTGLSLRDLQSRREMTIDNNGIAQIHVLGVMGRGLAPIEKVCGRTDYADLEREARMANQTARAALFDFDTPGGSAVGVDQTAKAVAGMTIPTAGSVDTMDASAGIYVGAGLGRMFISSGAVMGGVGAVLPWEDTSRMAELSGRKIRTFVSEGATLKGIQPDVPLTPEQEAWLQQFTNRQGSMFKEHLQNFRNVDAEVFKAGLYFGADAVRVGLADEVGSKEQALAYLLTQING